MYAGSMEAEQPSTHDVRSLRETQHVLAWRHVILSCATVRNSHYMAVYADCILQAAAPALCHWLTAFEEAGPDLDPAGPSPGHFRPVSPSFSQPGYAKMVHSLFETLTLDLDSQQKWKEFELAEHGLRLLCYISTSMGSAPEALRNQERDLVHSVEESFDFLSIASRFCTVFLHIMPNQVNDNAMLRLQVLAQDTLRQPISAVLKTFFLLILGLLEI